jgi:hypothetical protein
MDEKGFFRPIPEEMNEGSRGGKNRKQKLIEIRMKGGSYWKVDCWLILDCLLQKQSTF